MSAYLDTRVSLYAGRLWRDEALDALVGAPDETVADTLTQRGLSQLVAGYDRPAGQSQDSRSLEQRIIAQILDETRLSWSPPRPRKTETGSIPSLKKAKPAQAG